MEHPNKGIVWQQLHKHEITQKADGTHIFKYFAELMVEKAEFSHNYALHLALIYDMMNDELVLTLLPLDYSVIVYLQEIIVENRNFVNEAGVTPRFVQEKQDRLSESFICLKWLHRLSADGDEEFWQACVDFMQHGGRSGEAAALLISCCKNEHFLENIVAECQQYVIVNYNLALDAASSDQFVSSISLLSYCAVTNEGYNINIEEFYRWPAFFTRQTKHIVLILLCRHYSCSHNRRTLEAILSMIQDCYSNTLENAARIIGGDETMIDMLEDLGHMSFLELQFIALALSFDDLKHVSPEKVLKLIMRGLTPYSNDSEALCEAGLFLVFQCSREGFYPVEFFEQVEETVLPIALFNVNSQLRHAAAVCYEEIDGRILHASPIFCGELKHEEMEELEYCISLFEMAHPNHLLKADEYIERLLEHELEGAEQVGRCYRGSLALTHLEGTFEEIGRITRQCFLIMSNPTEEQIETLLLLNFKLCSLEEQFDFIEALSGVMLSYLQAREQTGSAIQKRMVEHLEKYVPFVCRFYFNEATLKELREDISLKSLMLYLDMQKRGFLEDLELTDDYLRLLHNCRNILDVDRNLSMLAALRGASAVFEKIVFINILKPNLKTMPPALAEQYINFFLADYSNDERGDIGSQIRYRAYHLLVLLVEEDSLFLNKFLKASVYFAMSRIRSFRVAALKNLTEILHIHHEDSDLIRITGFSEYHKPFPACKFDLAEPTLKQFDRSKREMLKISDEQQFAFCVELFGERYRRQCIRALLYSFDEEGVSKENCLALLGRFDTCDIMQEIKAALADASSLSSESTEQESPGFSYHLSLASMKYLLERKLDDELITGVLQFCRLKCLPKARIVDCLWVMHAAAVHGSEAAARGLFLMLGHRIEGVRDTAANMLVSWMLVCHYEEEIVAQFCLVSWSVLGVEEIKSERRRIAELLQFSL